MRKFIAIWGVFVLTGFLLVGCGSSVERNIDRLGGSADDREEAMLELVLAKQNAIPPLIEALGDEKRPSQVRADVAEILFRMYVRESDRRIVPALLGHIDDEDAKVRAKIAIVLGDIGEEEALGPLLGRLEIEGDSEVNYALLSALETLGNLLLDPQRGWGVVVDIKMNDEEKERLVRILKDISRGEADEDTRVKAEDMLEVIAEEITRDAEKLVLKGDIAKAEEKYSEAKDLVPESMNVNQKLGRFYFDNGEEEKGLSILEKYGMVAYVKKLSSPPIIDGDLSDASWERMAPHTTFYQCIYKMKAYPIEGKSEAYMGYTDKSLFIAVKGYEPSTNNLKAAVKNRDGSVHADDCVEVFFDTKHDYLSFYHIMVNSLGVVADQHRPGGPQTLDRSWNGEYKIATKVEEKFWTLEMEIPFKEFNAKVKRGTIWGFDLARVRIANASEYGQWVPTYGNAHRPDRFGFLIFD